MLKIGDIFRLSASDLVGHLNCRNLTELDLAVANGTLAKPKSWPDPQLDVLGERGIRHEHDYVDHLRKQGHAVQTIPGVGFETDAVAATAQAMTQGIAVIVQGAFLTDNWGGRVDILSRVEIPSALGPWSYEVVDTKLSRETKGGTVLQLSLCSDLVGRTQGLTPQWSHVVVPWSDFHPQSFRTDDFAAYYRRVRNSLQQAVTLDQPIDVYPDPKPFCEVCRWQERCESKRRADDHLSLVAGISKTQITELSERNITTGDALTNMPIPLTFKPTRGSANSLERVREQARMQAKGKVSRITLIDAVAVTFFDGVPSSASRAL
jgi:predicted RecB family nuclease